METEINNLQAEIEELEQLKQQYLDEKQQLVDAVNKHIGTIQYVTECFEALHPDNVEVEKLCDIVNTFHHALQFVADYHSTN